LWPPQLAERRVNNRCRCPLALFVCRVRSEPAHPQAPTPLASNRGPNSGIAVAALRSAPWRPTGGNLVRICDIHRPWTWRPPQFSGSATGLSAINVVGRAPRLVVRASCASRSSNSEPNRRTCSADRGSGRTAELGQCSRLFINRAEVYGSDRRISLSI
jgi:hypothetical protein